MTQPEPQSSRKTRIPMLKSGHCEHPSTPEHPGCRLASCACGCHCGAEPTEQEKP